MLFVLEMHAKKKKSKMRKHTNVDAKMCIQMDKGSKDKEESVD